MTVQGSQPLARRCVPDPYGAVAVAGREPLAVRRECHRVHPKFVILQGVFCEGSHHLPRGNVPQGRRAVVAGRRRQLPVGGKSDGRDDVPVPEAHRAEAGQGGRGKWIALEIGCGLPLAAGRDSSFGRIQLLAVLCLGFRHSERGRPTCDRSQEQQHKGDEF
jgi:hypothetical protein